RARVLCLPPRDRRRCRSQASPIRRLPHGRSDEGRLPRRRLLRRLPEPRAEARDPPRRRRAHGRESRELRGPSRLPRPEADGHAENALKLKSYWECFRTRNHLLTMLELAEIETDPEERRRLLSFVIAGGNYGGIEVAAEINDWARSLVTKEYRHIDADEVSVT